jgi:serine/threonine protein phosphatase 1
MLRFVTSLSAGLVRLTKRFWGVFAASSSENSNSAGKARVKKQVRTRSKDPKRETRSVKQDGQSSNAVLEKGQTVYAIGDIHGRADLLIRLLDLIDQDAESIDGDKHLVFLGDYIDRGFQSRQVIDILLGERIAPYQPHFIKGNHEDALLSFLSDPSFGPKWAAYGGRETMISYDVKPPRSLSLNAEWQKAHDAFVRAFPTAHHRFFLNLTTAARIGGYGFVHAGLRPGRSFDEQSDHDLMWIREEFLRDHSEFDVVVVHGHTPTDHPHHDYRRINVDTGAYFTGRLTAAKLMGDEVEFIST